jgi:hypothetical protein
MGWSQEAAQGRITSRAAYATATAAGVAPSSASTAALNYPNYLSTAGSSAAMSPFQLSAFADKAVDIESQEGGTRIVEGGKPSSSSQPSEAASSRQVPSTSGGTSGGTSRPATPGGGLIGSKVMELGVHSDVEFELDWER